MNTKFDLQLLKEKIIRLNSKYSTSPIRLRNGQFTKLAFDVDGYIVGAEGLNFIMWSDVTKNINTEVLGMHIDDFVNLFKVYAASSTTAQNLENTIQKYREFGILKNNCQKLTEQKRKLFK